MEKLHSNQFTVNILPPATIYGPVDNRKYTLYSPNNHCSHTLTIGMKYSINHGDINSEDIFTANWKPKLGVYELSGRVYISGGEFDEQMAKSRYKMFQSQLPEMLAIIVKSDFELFKFAPWLFDAPIYIKFDSNIPSLNTLEYFGTPRKFVIDKY